jgi:hypothetical protein
MVNGYPLTVIGVSQAGFDGVEPGYAPQIRVPITMYEHLPPGGTFNRLNDRRFRWVEVFGRLKPAFRWKKRRPACSRFSTRFSKWRCSRRSSPKPRPSSKREFLKMHLELMPGLEGPLRPARVSTPSRCWR